MTDARQDFLSLLRLAGPLMLARLSSFALVFIDTVVVGQYSAQELAFLTLASVPVSVILVASVGFLNGVQVIAARSVGAGNLALAGAAWQRGVVDSLLVGGIAAVILGFGARGLFHVLGQPADLADGAAPVSIILALSLPFHLLYIATAFLLEAMHRPAAGVIAMVIAMAVNYGLNILLVTGAWGFPEMGAQGAAWATLFVRGLLVFGLVMWVLRLPEARNLRLFDAHPADRGARSEQRQIGVAAGSGQVFEVAAFGGMTVFAGMVGTMAVASYAIALNVTGLVFMIALGLASAAGVLVANCIGAGDGDRGVRAGWMGLGVGGIAMMILALGAWLGDRAIAGIYATDAALIAATMPLIALSAFVFFADGLQVIAANILRARGDVWFPTASHLFAYVIVMLPLGWFLAVHLRQGGAGLMWAIIIASAISGTVLVFRWAMLAGRPVLRASSSEREGMHS